MRSAVPASITPAVTSSWSSRWEIGMASVVLHAEPEVHYGVLDPGDHHGGAVFQVAVVAVIEVRDRRQRHFVAQANVVSQAGEEADPVGRGARSPLAELEAPHADAALQEESAAWRRVEVHCRGDVAHRLRHAVLVLGPEVHLAAQANARAGRAAQLERHGEAATLGGGVEAAAAAAREAVVAVAESEGAPEAVACRGCLRLCGGEL